MLTPTLLDTVRAEIAEHESALVKLRDIERLALELTPAAPPSAAPVAPTEANPPRRRPRARRTSARPRARASASSERRQAVLSLLSTRGPLAPRAIAEAIGEPVGPIGAMLRQLAQASEVVAQGATTDRVYDVARNGARSLPMSTRVRKELERATDIDQDGEKTDLEDQVLEILKRTGGRVALSEIEYQLRRRGGDVDRSQLERAARRLTSQLLAVRDPGGGLRLPERPVEAAALDAAGVDEEFA